MKWRQVQELEMQTHLELQVRISPLFYYYTNVFLNKDFVYDYQHGRIYRSIQLQGQFHIGLSMSPSPGSLATR